MAGVRMATVPRTHLVQPFVTALIDSPLGVVEGGPGFGKTTLLGEIVSAWPHDVHASWPGALRLSAALRAHTRPCLFVVDDADRLADVEREALTEFAHAPPTPHRVLLATRGHCPELRQVDASTPGPRLRGADLLLTPDDVARGLWGRAARPDVTAEAVHDATAGWPVAVASLLAEAGPVEVGPDGFPSGAILVAERVGALSDERRAAFARALSLPVMREPLLRLPAHGEDLLAVLLDAGVPLHRVHDDAWELRAPLDRLIARERLHPLEAADAARLSQDAGRLGEALVLRWESGQRHDVMDDLERARGAFAEDLLAHWRTRQDLTPWDLLRTPGAAERVLRAAERAGHPDAQPFRRQVEARGRPDGLLDERLRAQAARDLLHRGRTTAARRLAGELLREALGAHARAVALEVLARAARRRGVPADLVLAGRLFRESLALWRRAEEPGRVAEVRLALAWLDRDLANGSRAIERAAAVRAAAPVGGALWVQAAVLEADVLCDVGRCAQAERLLARVELLAGEWAGVRLRARAAVIRARAALHQERTAEAARWVGRACAPPAWMDGVCGLRTMAQAAEIWCRIGEPDRALSGVRLLGVLEAEPDLEAAMARAAVDSRIGDASRALRTLRPLLDGPAVPPRERWRVALLAANAALRVDARDAPALARAALRAATEAGQPYAPFVRERDLVVRLLRMAGPVAGGGP